MTIPSLTPVSTPPSTSDPTNFSTRGDDFLGDLPLLQTEINAMVAATNLAVAAVDADEASAAASASAAAASAASAFAAPGTSGTSVTPATIGAGAKALTIEAGKDLVAGMWVLAADDAAPSTNSMAGQIDSYDDGTGVLNFTVPADLVIGSGSHSAWTVSLTGPPANAAALAALTKRCTALSLIF